MERSNVEKTYDSSLNLFNHFFGSIFNACENEEEALKAKFFADLDAKIRSGDLKSDDAIEAYISRFPELAAKAPSLKRDIKAAVAYDEVIRGTKRAKEYKTAIEKKRAIEEKRENAEPLTPEEEKTAQLERFEKMDQAELKAKEEALDKKQELQAQELAAGKKPEEIEPLTPEEQDLKDYSDIKKWEKYSDKNHDTLDERSQKRGPAKHDIWNGLEEANEDLERWPELYGDFYNYQKEGLDDDKSQEKGEAGQSRTQPNDGPEASKDGEKNDDKVVYSADKAPTVDDPETINWAKFREQVIWKNLDKITKSGSLTDMGFALFTTLIIDVAADAVDNLVKQTREINEANKKKAKDARNNLIDSNLKDKGLTRTTFARKLAVDAKRDILDTSLAEILEKKNPRTLTEGERFIVKRAQFARTLPRSKDGDIDFSKFTKKQQKKYDEYLLLYANSAKWLRESDQTLGLRVTKKEQAEIIAAARDARPEGGLEHHLRSKPKETEQKRAPEKAPKKEVSQPKPMVSETIRVEKIDKDIDKLVDKVATGEALNLSERRQLGSVLKDRGVSPQGIQDVKGVFEQQAKGKLDASGKPIKPSEEVRQSIIQVMVKGGLDDYVVADTMSKKKLTETDQAKIALQVDRQAKKKKALAEKMQANAAKSQALDNARKGMQKSVDQFRARTKEGKTM